MMRILARNTFSRVKGDPGTSAYLTKRVIEGTPYAGMGLGAQSLASGALYYNQGAASKMIGKYRELLEDGHYPVQDIYRLPPEEIMAKMISVSFYFGYINKQAFKSKFGISLGDKFLRR
jgi:oxygen-independent coproporphyrinogen-3 oxidase